MYVNKREKYINYIFFLYFGGSIRWENGVWCVRSALMLWYEDTLCVTETVSRELFTSHLE